MESINLLNELLSSINKHSSGTFKIKYEDNKNSGNFDQCRHAR